MSGSIAAMVFEILYGIESKGSRPRFIVATSAPTIAAEDGDRVVSKSLERTLAFNLSAWRRREVDYRPHPG